MLHLRLWKKGLLSIVGSCYLLLPVTTCCSLLCALNVHVGFRGAGCEEEQPDCADDHHGDDSAVTSVTAARAEDSSTMALPVA